MNNPACCYLVAWVISRPDFDAYSHPLGNELVIVSAGLYSEGPTLTHHLRDTIPLVVERFSAGSFAEALRDLIEYMQQHVAREKQHGFSSVRGRIYEMALSQEAREHRFDFDFDPCAPHG